MHREILDASSHHALLIIGPKETALQTIASLLQKRITACSGCKNCPECKTITEYQHPNVLYFAPTEGYTRQALDPLFEKIRYELALNETFFFIFEDTDQLSISCTNQLLKLVEEPPRGYHFIFQAKSVGAILPTLISRCQIYYIEEIGRPGATPKWLQQLMQPELCDPTLFLNEISRAENCDKIHYLDMLLKHWQEISFGTISSTTDPRTTDLIISHILSAYTRPPMPGSGKIFWKDLFLQIMHTVHISKQPEKKP